MSCSPTTTNVSRWPDSVEDVEREQETLDMKVDTSHMHLYSKDPAFRNRPTGKSHERNLELHFSFGPQFSVKLEISSYMMITEFMSASAVRCGGPRANLHAAARRARSAGEVRRTTGAGVNVNEKKAPSLLDDGAPAPASCHDPRSLHVFELGGAVKLATTPGWNKNCDDGPKACSYEPKAAVAAAPANHTNVDAWESGRAAGCLVAECLTPTVAATKQQE